MLHMCFICPKEFLRNSQAYFKTRDFTYKFLSLIYREKCDILAVLDVSAQVADSGLGWTWRACPVGAPNGSEVLCLLWGKPGLPCAH